MNDSIDATTTPRATAASSPFTALKKTKAVVVPKNTRRPAAKATQSTPIVKPANKTTTASAKPKTPAARPATARAVAADKPTKIKTKLKLVRDSFTMPQSDFELIEVLKQRAMNFRHAPKKSELLRAGLQVLAALPDQQLQVALARITPLKTGRPKKAD